jgi:hypothetical protein
MVQKIRKTFNAVRQGTQKSRGVIGVFVMAVLLVGTFNGFGKAFGDPTSQIGFANFSEQLKQGVQFRQGDRIPMNFHAEGDLLESADDHPIYLTVRRGFFMKMVGNDVLMSLDGAQYQKIGDLLKGTISADASAPQPSQIVSAINLKFQEVLK